MRLERNRAGLARSPEWVAPSSNDGLADGVGLRGLELVARVPCTDPCPACAARAGREQLRRRVPFNAAVLGARTTVRSFSHAAGIRALGGLLLAGQVVRGLNALVWAGDARGERPEVRVRSPSATIQGLDGSAAREAGAGASCNG